MKKTLSVLLALCGVLLVPAASAGSGSSSSVFGSNGNFTVTYKWDNPLSTYISSGINAGFNFGGDSGSVNLSFSIADIPYWGGLSFVMGTSINSLTTEKLDAKVIQLEYQNKTATYSVCYDNGTTDVVGSVTQTKDVTSITGLTVTAAGATVTLGDSADVKLKSLTTNGFGKIVTPANLTILSGPKNPVTNTVDNLEVNGSLTLGTAETAAVLEARGTITVTGGITLGNVASTITAAALDCGSLDVTMTDSELLKLTSGSTTVLTLGSAYNGSTTLNGSAGEYICGDKMIYSLKWETALNRASNAWVLNLYASPNASYVQDKLAGIAYTHNGRAGLAILSDAFVTADPQAGSPEGAVAGLLNTVDAGEMTDSNLAAAAGASVAVLGQAFSGDVERQLRAIRNRAVMGYKGADTLIVSKDNKGGSVDRFSLWVNAEGNRAEQGDDGTAAGYTLSSWGATLGGGMQVNQRLTLGLALTALYGELKSDGPDSLDGDMDTAYLSAFAQYQRGAWNHSFIGTVGTMESDYHRTVSHAKGSYSTQGDTEGTSLGLMYELSRAFALSGKSSISPVVNISYRRTEVDGYTERQSDAALSVGEQSLDTVTVGAGARYTATVGQRMLNRSCELEARALAKCDFGDRQVDTTAGFAGYGARAGIESAESGRFGMELGAGITVPTGVGSIFADGAVEFRTDYTNFNAAVGYKIQF